MSQTAIGEVLRSVDEADCEEFYQYYLHDFVRSVHRCHHKQEKSKNLEYKVQRSLGKVVERGYPLITIRNFHQLCFSLMTADVKTSEKVFDLKVDNNSPFIHEPTHTHK